MYQFVKNESVDAILYVEMLGSAGEAVADLKQLFSLAEKFGYSEWIEFDASVVRGLAYYTGIVFEVRFFVLLLFFLLPCVLNTQITT